jgi:hypothetical protein
MSKNVVEPEGQQFTSQCGAYALHAGWARLYARMRIHTPTRFIVTLYVYCVSCCENVFVYLFRFKDCLVERPAYHAVNYSNFDTLRTTIVSHSQILGAFGLSRKSPFNCSCLYVRPCVCPCPSARLSLDGFSWNLVLKTNLKLRTVHLKTVVMSDSFIWPW